MLLSTAKGECSGNVLTHAVKDEIENAESHDAKKFPSQLAGMTSCETHPSYVSNAYLSDFSAFVFFPSIVNLYNHADLSS